MLLLLSYRRTSIPGQTQKTEAESLSICKSRLLQVPSRGLCRGYKAEISLDNSWVYSKDFISFEITTSSAFLQILHILTLLNQKENNSSSSTCKPQAYGIRARAIPSFKCCKESMKSLSEIFLAVVIRSSVVALYKLRHLLKNQTY